MHIHNYKLANVNNLNKIKKFTPDRLLIIKF